LLRERNEEFKSLREVRSTVAAGANRLAGQAIRKVNDQTLNTIFRYIEAAYIASDNDPDRQVISRLIDQINQRTHESKVSFKRIEGIRKKRLQMKDSAEATDTKAPPKRKRSAADPSAVPPMEPTGEAETPQAPPMGTTAAAALSAVPPMEPTGEAETPQSPPMGTTTPTADERS
jgi:hypothetical protein